ncbi:hypothetical protein T03_10395 [Trichinella britovi]|uniref:Uncharacterized protein n=1 Tax=Trichinella britovi TaxID=45882 RepID=A0A0V1C6P4_TRIBR|nr:hypothetical protein T03_10395 [Trichinella britovi]
MKKRHYFVPCQAPLFKIIEKIVLIAIAVVIICASAFQLRTSALEILGCAFQRKPRISKLREYMPLLFIRFADAL